MLSMANIKGTGDGMERSITRGELEAALVRSCAPVLLGVKPANLFTFCGCFGCGGADGDTSSCPSPVAPSDDARCARRRDALSRLVRDLDATLTPYGMRCRVIAWRSFGALVLAYRPTLVERCLKDAEVARELSCLGYPARLGPVSVASSRPCGPQGPARVGNALDGCVEHLARRFGERGVPHEVGYFLGYPAADVRGFVENEGRDYLCCGCWKVYADVRGAMRRFARYKRCTRRVLHLYGTGVPLTELARDPACAQVA